MTRTGGGGLNERNFDEEYWRKGNNHECKTKEIYETKKPTKDIYETKKPKSTLLFDNTTGLISKTKEISTKNIGIKVLYQMTII